MRERELTMGGKISVSVPHISVHHRKDLHVRAEATQRPVCVQVSHVQALRGRARQST